MTPTETTIGTTVAEVVEVYFKTTTAALGAKVSLGALYGCSQPLHVSPPRQGMSVVLRVTIPSGLASPATKARTLARIVSIANRYDGQVIDTQNNQEIAG